MVGEIALIAGSSIAGAFSAAVINKISKGKADSKKHEELFARPPSSIRSEFTSLQFEKSLVGEAITRVYEAFQEGKIDRIEKDRLLVKYRQQLDSLNQMIGGIEPASDLANLTEIRNSLVSLLEERISAIDCKIAEMSGKSGNQNASSVVQIKQEIENAHDTSHESKKPVKEAKSADEKNIAQLQSEIMQALYKLEQVELDKD